MRELRAKFQRRRRGQAGRRADAPSHRSATMRHWRGGRRRGRRAWLRCPWAAAGPGRASRSTTPSEARSADDSRAGRRPRAHKAARPDSTPRGARNTSGATRRTATQTTQTRGSPRGPPRVHATRSDTQHSRECKHSTQSRVQALSTVENSSTQRSRAATTSATWTAFRAAPLRRLSPETTRTRPRLPSTAWS